MKHTLLVVALLVLGSSGCGSKAPDTPATAPPVAATPVAAQPAPSTAAIDKAAAATQETVTVEPGAEKGDAKLERLAALPENTQLPSGRWKSGVNYRPVVPAQTTSAEAGQVEVLEIFWYGCAHCFALEPFLESWNKTKQPFIKFVRVPVMWGAAHRAHARLFYTLEALGKLDALHGKVFAEIHQRGNLLIANDEAQSFKLQLAFAKANGISEADFTREYNGFSVNAKMQRAEELTRRYRVEGVPVVFVNGKYQTDVGMAGGQAQLVEVINDLAANDKRR